MPKRTHDSSFAENLEEAAESVRKGLSFAKAAKNKGVRKSTLFDNTKKTHQVAGRVTGLSSIHRRPAAKSKRPPNALPVYTEVVPVSEHEITCISMENLEQTEALMPRKTSGSNLTKNLKQEKRKAAQKRAYNSSTAENLEPALEAVKRGMSYAQAAQQYGVKRSTLHDKSKNRHPKAVGRPQELRRIRRPSAKLKRFLDSCAAENVEATTETRTNTPSTENQEPAAVSERVENSTLADNSDRDAAATFNSCTTENLDPTAAAILTRTDNIVTEDTAARKRTQNSSVVENSEDDAGTPRKRAYNSSTAEDLEKAMEAVRKGLSFSKAAKKYGVKRSTLCDKVNKRHMKAVGRPTELSANEETILCNGLLTAARRGIPLNVGNISGIVKRYLDERNMNATAFKDNRPGKTWVAKFCKRHRLSLNTKRIRTNVAREDVAEYIEELASFVQEGHEDNIVDEITGMDVPKIQYKPDAAPDDVFCFKHYNPKEKLVGRAMQDWLRFSVCFWHTFRGTGADPFGFPTLVRPWDDGSDSIENAKRRLKVAFDFLDKLGIKYWSFHDRDIAPEGATLAETNANLDDVSDYALSLMKEKGIKLLWNTCNLFAHPRYMNGAATNPDAHVLAYAGAQVKKSLEIAKKMEAENFVFWGGREGYHTLLNTDVRAELDQMANFFKMVVAYKEKIGFAGQLLIEPKPKEPAKHQYDYDAMTVIAFLKTYDLDKDFKLNIEPNHTTLAGHCYEHDIVMASAYGMLGSVDSNTGSPDLGWDTDQFPMDVKSATLVMKTILQQGGLSPGGLNFDCKVRRESTDLEDMLIAHIGAMDCFARGLRNAVKIIQDGIMERAIKERYSSFSSGFGANVKAGIASLEDCDEYIAKNGNPVLKSGKQEKMELILNRYV